MIGGFACQGGQGAARSGELGRETMVAILNFVFFILGALLSLLWWAIIISAILSWLVAFDIINLRNQAIYQISTFLDRVTAPVLRPFQRIIPPLGGVDISPIVVLLIITGVQQILLPALHVTLIRLVGGGY
jgi:YggT family protein